LLITKNVLHNFLAKKGFLMSDKETKDIEIIDDVNRFTDTYTAFSRIINKIQRQYLTLKETYTSQSKQLQSVNRILQTLISENRVVSEFLNSILNSLVSGVIAVDSSGQITLLNPAARKILGIVENEEIHRRLHYDEIIRALDKKEYSPLITMKNARPYDSVEKRVETLYGTIVTLSVSTSLLKNDSGEITGAVEMFHDISKLKQMEDQLSRMKILAALGEMAASIAHEIRNPLAGIGGFASLLARDLADDPSRAKMAQRIVEGVGSINQTIQTLLEFAREEKLNKTSIDLAAYIETILDNFGREYGPGFSRDRIEYTPPSGENIAVEIDPLLFKQAMYNLLKNGLEAAGDDSVVEVKVRKLPLAEAQKEYAGRLELSGTETLAEIIVADNGPGIAVDAIERLFSPFYSTKENGIGLGLSIAWKIIKAHCGDITARSDPGRGTKFSIALPVKNSLRTEI
jgi:PAS domain S-box-containing protein